MTLSSDVVVATFPKNGNEHVRVGLGSYGGHDLVQIRVWFDAGAGDPRPGKQGLALRLAQLPALIDALEQTADEAQRLGLLDRVPA